MTKAVFLVYASRNQWWVDCEGRATGPYLTRAAAIVEAIPQAQAMLASGRPAEVLAPGDDRHHHVAWPPVTMRRRHEAKLAG